ncbi:beta-ketoacyl synthase chain length factor [Lichenicoccus roseus]|uniref:Beta-ketoacyl synthase chain length factor n=1 Tax=Lichenicoccus roseus TaxID=2683649 RepID=A0A5R9J952_9PROT|nr:beta-ketoacyl synthase chain length factor [Lichenicoccus roseus]TLU74102.1 beta-ketoacyl synthase chain length factor [Lichenicoccus roseus]
MRVSLIGAAVRAPGLGSWEQARAVLAGELPLDPDALLDLPPPALLSPNERRRAGLPVRLALAVCEEASRMAGHEPGALPGIFGSSNGDGAVVHDLLETLASADPQLSPTRFHNSVHNAVAGYWSIATGSSAPITVLGCHDATFAASLLKAASECVAEAMPILLCLYDAPMKLPLGALRTTTIGLSAAFVLAPARPGAALADLDIAFTPDAAPPEPEPIAPGLRSLWRQNPVGRGLVLLEAVTRKQPVSLAFPYGRGQIAIVVQP